MCDCIWHSCDKQRTIPINKNFLFIILQVKEDILNEAIYCPAEKAVLLASYQVQSKFIDYDPEAHPTGYLANEKLLCKTVVDQHKLSMEEWEEKISSFHKQHRVW